jgi:F420-0:gamma-glutamyl ligase
MEDAEEQGFSDGQNPVDLAGREGSVEEEANLDVLLAVADLLAQHLREQHQVVVVDPDHISVLDVANDRLGKEAVDLAVCAPCRLVERDLTGMVVEERP